MDVLFLKYKTYCMENIKGDHLSDGTIWDFYSFCCFCVFLKFLNFSKSVITLKGENVVYSIFKNT